MEYEALMDSLPKDQITEVEMNDGRVLQCRKVPLSTLESVSVISGGLQKSLNPLSSSLNYIATCGKTKLYAAVDDSVTHMKRADGSVLSAVVGEKGKIASQSGFREIGTSQEGLNTAVKAAKIIPVLTIAVTVVEVGAKIFLKQQEIKQTQTAYYDKYAEISEDNINNLWQALNDYTLSREDDAHRTADLVTIKTALNEGKNSFRKLAKEAESGKKINEHLIYALKTSLDVCSLGYLLNVMYAKTDNCAEYVNRALKDIEEMTAVFTSAYEKRWNQFLENRERHEKRLGRLQFYNNNLDKKTLAKRAGIDVLSGGLTELGSLAVKGIEKKLKKQDDATLSMLEACRYSGNPYAECIKNAQGMLLNKTPLLRDCEYIYYPVEED